jgi:hypothetical protein
MKRLVQIPPETARDLKKAAQTGPGYQIVSVELVDGRTFDPAVVSEGHVIQVRGFKEVPFAPQDVARVKLSHRRWNFRRDWPESERPRIRAASAWLIAWNFIDRHSSIKPNEQMVGSYNRAVLTVSFFVC